MNIRLLGNLSVRAKVVLLVASPLILSLWFIGQKLLELNKNAQINTVEAGQVLEHMSDLVHTLQFERGLSAGYLESATETPPEKLLQVRSKNDAAMASFLEEISHFDLSRLPEESVQAIQYAKSELLRKKEIRMNVDTHSIELKHMFAYYTELNSALIQTGIALAKQIDDPLISQETVALSFFMRAIDAAGLERAAGVVGFKHGWKPEDRELFVAEHELFKERLRAFRDFATAEDRSAVEDLLATPEMKEFEDIRNEILHGANETLSEGQWFETASKALKAMQKKERYLIEHLERDMAEFDSANKLLLYEMGAFAAVLLVGVLFLSAVVARNMTEGLTVLNVALQKLGSGETDVEVPGANRRDEIGSVARNVLDLRAVTLRNKEEQAELEKENRDKVVTVARRIGEALANLQHKRLNKPIQEFFPEEFNSIKMDMNDSLLSLSEAISNIGELTSSVDGNTKSIAQASKDLAHRTEEESATLEKTTHAISELTSNVQRSAENAGTAERLASNAKDGVRSCDEVMKNTISAMDQLLESSHEISQITKVIQDIAFQTNLLALNAGVEAARAGEAGRGFAVVASEVRMLAQRCADAVQQIDELTARSSEQVKNGASLVEEAGRAMAEVSEHVTDISGLVVEIAGNMKEQSTQMGDVNTSVNELDLMAQQNAAMAEETTAATTVLSEQAQELREMVQQFTVGQVAPAQNLLSEHTEITSPSSALPVDVEGGWDQDFRSDGAVA